MKPCFIFLITIFCFDNSFGQITKGNWLAGGTGSLFSYNGTYRSPNYNYDSKYTQIDLSASVGYFITDKLALGLRPVFSQFKGEITSEGGGITNMKKYGIGPFGRYYFLSVDRPFNIVGDISYQYGINDWHGQSGNINYFSAMAGPVIYFNTSVGLEVLLGYTSRKEDIRNSHEESRKGFQVGVGFQIHLEKE